MKISLSKKLVFIILIVGIVSLFMITSIYKKEVSSRHLEMDIKGSYAMLVQSEEDKKYYEYMSSEWPQKGYMYSKEATTCYYENGTILNNEGLIWYSNRYKEVHVTNDKTTYCYLYFDVDKTPPVVDNFYIKESSKYTANTKYTNKLNNRMVFTWSDSDVEAYCLTNKNDVSTCNWEQTTDKYENDKVIEEGIETSIDKEYNLPDVADGVVTMYVFLRDFAGNISSTTALSTDSIILDRTPPVIENFSVSSKDSRYNKLEVSSSIKMKDNYGLESYNITGITDTAKKSIASHPLEKTISPDLKVTGSYDGKTRTLRLTVIDVAGNSSFKETSYKVYKNCSKTTAGSWSDWGSCSASCGGGTKSRSRTLTDTYLGGYCSTDTDSESCNTQDCCSSTYQACDDWGSCSASCGTGTKYRTCYARSSYDNSICNSYTNSDSCDAGSCGGGGGGDCWEEEISRGECSSRGGNCVATAGTYDGVPHCHCKLCS